MAGTLEISLGYLLSGTTWLSCLLFLMSPFSALADPSSHADIDAAEPNIHLRKGVEYSNGGKYVEATREFSEAIRLAPGFALAFTDRAVAYERLDQLKQALKDANTAVQLDRFNPVCLSNRGAIECRLGLMIKALKDDDEAILYDSRNPVYYENRGKVYKKMGRFREARADFLSAKVFYQEFGQTESSEAMSKFADEMAAHVMEVSK